MLSIKVPYNDAKTSDGNVKFNEREYMGENRQEIYLHIPMRCYQSKYHTTMQRLAMEMLSLMRENTWVKFDRKFIFIYQ